jgi:nucleotide-binding universal stress UspA family protein
MVDIILHTADAEDCDLIVMGSHTCSWRSRRLRQHVIKTLIARAKQPLLVVPALSPEACSELGGSRLLVAHHGSASGTVAVHHALALARAALLDVCLLHVNTLRQDDAVASLSVTPGVQDMLTLAAARTAIAGVNHNVVLASGHTVTAIVETAAAQE